jgi:3-oxoacyl-[acyl-carrier protein] reductase
MDANLSSPVPDLEGKTVFVTGAGSGMGKNISAAVLEKGGNVFSLEISAENIKAATAELDGGERLAWYEGSVAVKADVEAAFAAAAERFGDVHHLVNNAGVALMSLVQDMTESDWDLMVDTLLKGTFLCTQAFARQAIPNGAGRSIVNISSLNAVAVTEGMGHYCAAKAGVKVLGEVCAAEFGRYGIRVNSVGPGTTVTPMSVYARMGRMGQEFLDRTLVHPARHQETSDIADVVLFLMSPAAQRITGHFIPVDGGQHIRGLHSYADVMAEMFAAGEFSAPAE